MAAVARHGATPNGVRYNRSPTQAPGLVLFMVKIVISPQKNDKITKNVILFLDFLEFGITVSLRTPRNPFPDSRNTKTTLVKQT